MTAPEEPGSGGATPGGRAPKNGIRNGRISNETLYLELRKTHRRILAATGFLTAMLGWALAALAYARINLVVAAWALAIAAAIPVAMAWALEGRAGGLHEWLQEVYRDFPDAEDDIRARLGVDDE